MRSSSATPTPTPTPSPSPSSNLPQPPLDAQLSLTNAYAAQKLGYTGAGVTIGVVDSGIMRSNPAVAGRVLQELIYVDPTQNNTSIDDVVGHGTWVSEIAAGTSFAQFAGGIAPGANLVSARIISDNSPDDNGSSPPAQVTTSDATFLGQVNADMVSAGVKVMNNSWGGITWDTTNANLNAAFDLAYLPFVNKGGLVVFAAGNDSQANPSTIASLPTVANDYALQQGWLVTVALNSNNPTQLESYSNKCGIAMSYCLAAPGDVIVLDKNATATATNPSYYIVEGTSFAAPAVAGAAALVWQAYPYFTNDMVRQTLLGTATPLGGSQPNPTFGYGALNVGAAVNGPELLDWGTIAVNNLTTTSNWNNPLRGAGALTMNSPGGTLNLTQPASYTGPTLAEAGTLTAVSLGSYETRIAPGATVAFRGAPPASTPSIAGYVWNSGVLAVSPNSNLTVALNYAQGTSTTAATIQPGELAVSLGSSLQVSGSATLPQGSILYVYGVNSGYVANSHTEVLTAAGGLTGTFASFSWSPSVVLQATLGYGPNDAYLNVASVSLTQVPGVSYAGATYSAAARTQNAFNTINNVIQNGSSAPLPSSFVSGAASIQQSPTAAALQQSLNSLSGQMYAASAAMTFEAIDADTRALSDRFDSLLDNPQALDRKHDFQSWSQNLGYQGSFSRSGYDSLGFQLNGTMVGGDRMLGNGGVVGYAISHSQGLGNLQQSADQGFSRALEGMIYGGFVQGNWYTMGRFGVGSDWQNTRRELLLGNQYAGVGSVSNGRYEVAYSESGYRFNAGNWKLTPYADLEYADVSRDGFNELGGDGFGLTSGSQSIQRWQAGIGLRGSRQWLMADGSSLSLHARLLWQDAFAMRGVLPSASFAALQQFSPINGIGLSRYGSIAGVSLDWRFSSRSNLSIGVDEYDAQRAHATMGTFNYSLRF